MKASPLGILFAIVILGITVEVIEQKDRTAAYVVVILILLGIVTFNAAAFQDQMGKILALVNRPSKPKSQPNPGTQPAATPRKRV